MPGRTTPALDMMNSCAALSPGQWLGAAPAAYTLDPCDRQSLVSRDVTERGDADRGWSAAVNAGQTKAGAPSHGRMPLAQADSRRTGEGKARDRESSHGNKPSKTSGR